MKKSCLFFLLALIFFATFSLQFAEAQSDESKGASADEEAQITESESVDEEAQTNESESVDEETVDEAEIDEAKEPLVKNVLYKPLDLAGADHALTEKWRKTYSTAHNVKWISNALSNGEAYRLYVRSRLAERNLPAVLEYLPMVESNYVITAKSKSGALGMWQFMENSIRPYLQKNEFIDERLDPWKSTEAALSKLEDNYKIFGDWAIAIAAYNCGSGAMSRALKSAKEKSFWYLAEKKLLRNETLNYVPKLLAIADLVENPEYYNIELPPSNHEADSEIFEVTNYFDYVTVDKPYSIRRLAAEMRIDENTLLMLNPSLTQGITPPSAQYTIRLPVGMEQSAKDALSEIEPWGFTEKHVIKAGDTLWGLARSNNTTVQAICDANGISEKTILQIGKVLFLPPK